MVLLGLHSGNKRLRTQNPLCSWAAPLEGYVVLLAEDETDQPSAAEMRLCAAGAEVLLASTAYQAQLVAQSHALTAAVLDLQFGPHAIAQLNSFLGKRSVPFLIVSSQASGGDSPREGVAGDAPGYGDIVAGPDLVDALVQLVARRRAAS